jgi:hypothetical protein
MANQQNIEPYKWKPGQSGNPNGRPRKMVSQVIQDLSSEGIEHVKKSHIIGAIEVLLNCTESELEAYANDKSQSQLIRIVAKHLLKAGDDNKLFSMLLDRAFGKPDKTIDHSGEVQSSLAPKTLDDWYNENRY